MAKTAILAVKIISDAKDATAGLNEAGGMFSKLGGVATAAGVAVAGAAVAAGAFALDAIGSAANLEQSIGAVDTVFKGGAAQMHEWAQTAATTVGLAENEYNELATVIGTQLKNGGTSLDQLGGKTNDLIGVGADLASMFGGTTADAVGALSSALKGERDPIERYGVSLNQAAIDAKAASLGFTKVGGSLSAEANQAATLALIMDQTADAHGNFARESDTLSHKQQVAAAQAQNLKDALGTALLPAASAAMGAVLKLGEAVGPKITPLFASLGQAASGIGEQLGPVFATLAPLVTGFFQTFSSNMLATSGSLAAFAGMGGALAGMLTQLAPVIAGMLPTLAAIGGVVADTLGSALTFVAGVLTQLATAVFPVVVAGIANIMPIVFQLANSVRDFVNVLIDVLSPTIDALVPIIATAFGVIMDVIGSAFAIINGIVKAATAILSGDWAGAWDAIKDILANAWDGITTLVSGALDVIKSLLSVAGDVLVGILGRAWDGITAAAGAAWNALGDGFARAWAQLVDSTREVGHNIVSTVNGWSADIERAGLNMMMGLVNGIRDAAGAVIRAATSVVGDAIGAAKNLLGIHSPSRVFADIGRQTGAGLVVGLQSQASAVRDATRDLIDIPSAAAMTAPTLTPLGPAYPGTGPAIPAAGAATVTVNVNGFVGNNDELATAIADALNGHARRTGRVNINGRLV